MQKITVGAVSIQGQPSSFSHRAAKAVCQPQNVLFRDNFGDVFEDLANGQTDLIVVPIENSTYGSVYENYDNLTRYPAVIVAETYIRVDLHLLGLESAEIGRIKRVFSHQVALDQIQNFRRANRQIEFLPHADTAGAAGMVKDAQDQEIAAVAGDDAAQKHGLKVIERSIEDNPQNFTRFFAVARNNLDLPNNKPDKTTVQFELGEEAGSLYKTLRSFADRDLPLSKIESRPITNTAWNYRFYLDVAAGTDDSRLQHALSEMKDYVKDNQVIILGSYPSGQNQPAV